jgi:hypothetical protein
MHFDGMDLSHMPLTGVHWNMIAKLTVITEAKTTHSNIKSVILIHREGKFGASACQLISSDEPKGSHIKQEGARFDECDLDDIGYLRNVEYLHVSTVASFRILALERRTLCGGLTR